MTALKDVIKRNCTWMKYVLPIYGVLCSCIFPSPTIFRITPLGLITGFQ